MDSSTENPLSPSEMLAAWQVERTQMVQRIETLEHQLNWFKRQLFGSKSERRLVDIPSEQMSLGEGLGAAGPAVEIPPDEPTTVQRKHQARPASDAADDETKLFFDDSVPVEVIAVANPECDGLAADERDVISEKVSYRLAQRPGDYVILKYVRQVIKRKSDQTLHCPSAPTGVIEGGRADASFLAGMVIDKLLYHLPLYRQHQRLAQSGIQLSRSWLTQQFHAVGSLLEPIHQAQLQSIRQSRVKAMDETPIKAGRSGKGKLNTGYFWPVYGEQDEVAFLFYPSRAARHVHEALTDQAPEDAVLLSDGYSAYARYAEKIGLTHAQCWAHTRRTFFEAKEVEPDATAHALGLIGELYAIEANIRDNQLEQEARQQYRKKHTGPVVERFFNWAKKAVKDSALLPSNPMTKALSYALERQDDLTVFVNDPDVPIDTNHLERTLRAIPMGRKNWMFCWTEAGAHYLGVLQSLIVTCRLHGIKPYDYLVDVLQRIDQHPASKVTQLTPRLWKQHFADDPLRSPLYFSSK